MRIKSLGFKDMMSQLNWLPDWETGFQDIDEQHQNLIEQINQLMKMSGQDNTVLVMQTLFDFVSSAMSHFAHEEEMLAEAGYPLVETRRTTNENFTNRLISYQDRIFTDSTVLEELLPQIEVWIRRHIELNDQAYIDTVRKSGIYQINEKGLWVRAKKREPLLKAEKPAEPEKKDDDDQPRGWATGAW